MYRAMPAAPPIPRAIASRGDAIFTTSPFTRIVPRITDIAFAVADEESGSAHGARWVADHHPDAIRADYVLTENGGIHSGPAETPFIGVNVAEHVRPGRRSRAARAVEERFARTGLPRRVERITVRGSSGAESLDPGFRNHREWSEEAKRAPAPKKIGCVWKSMMLKGWRRTQTADEISFANSYYLMTCRHAVRLPF